jgi:hypothetical protein
MYHYHKILGMSDRLALRVSNFGGFLVNVDLLGYVMGLACLHEGVSRMDGSVKKGKVFWMDNFCLDQDSVGGFVYR